MIVKLQPSLMERFLLHVIPLLFFLFNSNPVLAQDDICIDSTGTLDILSPGSRIQDVEDIVVAYFSNNGYTRNGNRFEIPDHDCFVLLENNGSISLKVYLLEGQLAELDKILIPLSYDLNNEFDKITLSRRRVHVITSKAFQDKSKN